MKKILTIGLAVLLAVFVGSMIYGSSQLYAFSGEAFNGPAISPGSGIAYDSTLDSANSYAMIREIVNGPSISTSSGIAWDNTLAGCPSYAMNRDVFSGPLVSAEIAGMVKGTEDEFTLLALLCE